MRWRWVQAAYAEDAPGDSGRARHKERQGSVRQCQAGVDAQLRTGDEHVALLDEVELVARLALRGRNNDNIYLQSLVPGSCGALAMAL